MRNLIKTTAIAVGLAVMAGAGAIAQEAGGKMPGGGKMGGQGKMAPLMSAVFMKALDRPEFVQSVGLSDAQVSKLKSLGADMKSENEKDRASLAPLEKELRGMMEQDKPDIGKAEALVEKIGIIKTDMQKTSVRTMLEMKASLTTEQISKIKELAKEFGNKGKGGKGKKGGGRGGPNGGGSDDSGPQGF